MGGVDRASDSRLGREVARLATALTGTSPETKSAAEISQVLAQLFSAVSDKKVDVRQASLLAYIAELMLQTIKLSQPSAL